MRRRNFVRLMSTVAAPGAVGSMLAACGSGSGSGSEQPSAPAPPPPQPSSGRVSYGALLLDEGALAEIPRTLSPAYQKAGAPLPRQVDLRVSGYLPSAGDQESLPSCTAWAVGYASASYYKALAYETPPTSTSLMASPADLYAKLLQVRSDPCLNGTYITDGLDILLRSGVGSLAQVPYLATACVAPASIADFQITGYQNLAVSDSESIKRELAAGNVLPFGAQVYDELAAWGFGPSNTGIYRIGQRSGGGGHAMTLVGYDDDRQAWLVQNSWGLRFGDAGCFWFDYAAFAETANQVFTVVGSAAPSPGPVPPGPSPAPSPQPGPLPVAFRQLQPTTYIDYYYGVSVFNYYFTLDQPFFVETAQVVESGPYGSFVLGPVTVQQWVLSSYFQWLLYLPQSFPPGDYTLVLRGVDQAGQQQELRGARAMALNETQRRESLRLGPDQGPFGGRALEPRFLRLGDTL